MYPTISTHQNNHSVLPTGFLVPLPFSFGVGVLVACCGRGGIFLFPARVEGPFVSSSSPSPPFQPPPLEVEGLSHAVGFALTLDSLSSLCEYLPPALLLPSTRLSVRYKSIHIYCQEWQQQTHCGTRNALEINVQLILPYWNELTLLLKVYPTSKSSHLMYNIISRKLVNELSPRLILAGLGSIRGTVFSGEEGRSVNKR